MLRLIEQPAAEGDVLEEGAYRYDTRGDGKLATAKTAVDYLESRLRA
jgi:hypothetical protein